MLDGDDAERDAFCNMLQWIAFDRGWLLECQRQDVRFQRMLARHGEAQVRGWLLLHALQSARRVALIQRVYRDDSGCTRLAEDAWLGPGVLRQLVAYYRQTPLRG